MSTTTEAPEQITMGHVWEWATVDVIDQLIASATTRNDKIDVYLSSTEHYGSREQYLRELTENTALIAHYEAARAVRQLSDADAAKRAEIVYITSELRGKEQELLRAMANLSALILNGQPFNALQCTAQIASIGETVNTMRTEIDGAWELIDALNAEKQQQLDAMPARP